MRCSIPLALLLAMTVLPTAARAQEVDPVTELLRAEADRRDAIQVKLEEARVAIERLDIASAAALETIDRVQASLENIKARLQALEDGVPPEEPPPIPPGPVPPPAPAPATPFEWMVLTPSPDTRTFYVSATGNDANDGLSEATPVRTPMVAYSRLRTGFPDWMLLKRGDTWDGNGGQFAFVGEGGRSGRSATEPLVIGSYGESKERPKLISGRVRPLDGDKHIRVVGLEFRFSQPLVTDNGVTCNGARVEDLLIEDCAIIGYPSGISLQGQGKRLKDVRIRGTVVADSTGQGILADGVDGLLIDCCVFDHNGWREDVPGHPSNGFNHNMYLTGTNTGVIVRETISARASSHAVSMSAGGLAVDNLILQSPIGIWGHKSFAARWNVVLDARDLAVGGPRGMALGADEIVTAEFLENIVAHAVRGSQCHAISFGGETTNTSVVVAGNLIYEWTGVPNDLAPIGLYWYGQPHGVITVSDNVIEASRGTLVQHDVAPVAGKYRYTANRYRGGPDQSKWWHVVDDLAGFAAWQAASGETSATTGTGTYPDAGRTIETYSVSLGGQPTLAWFMAEARKQSKLNWRWAYTARVASNYVREGFGLAHR